MQCPMQHGVPPVVVSYGVFWSLAYPAHAPGEVLGAAGGPWCWFFHQSSLPLLGVHILCYLEARVELQEHLAHCSHPHLLVLWVATPSVLGEFPGKMLVHCYP